MAETIALNNRRETLNPFEQELFKVVDTNKTKQRFIDGYTNHKRQTRRIEQKYPHNQDLLKATNILEKDFERRLQSLVERNNENDKKLRDGYEKALEKHGVGFDELQDGINKVKNTTNTDEFTKKLMEMDKPLESPLLEPLDILLMTYGLAKLGIKLSGKLLNFTIDRGGKLILNTALGKQVVNLGNVASKEFQKVIQYAVNKYNGVKEMAQNMGAQATGLVTEGASNSLIGETVKVANGKGSNVLRSEAVKEGGGKITNKFRVENGFRKLDKQGFQDKFNNEILEDFNEKLNILQGPKNKLDGFFEDHKKALEEIRGWLRLHKDDIKNLSNDFKIKLNDYLSGLISYGRHHGTKYFNDILDNVQIIRIRFKKHL